MREQWAGVSSSSNFRTESGISRDTQLRIAKPALQYSVLGTQYSVLSNEPFAGSREKATHSHQQPSKLGVLSTGY